MFIALLICSRSCSKCFIHINLFEIHDDTKICSIIIPSLRIRKRSYRLILSVVQDHRAYSRWSTQDHNQTFWLQSYYVQPLQTLLPPRAPDTAPQNCVNQQQICMLDEIQLGDYIVYRITILRVVIKGLQYTERKFLKGKEFVVKPQLFVCFWPIVSIAGYGCRKWIYRFYYLL